MSRRFPELRDIDNESILRWASELVRVLEDLDDDANSITSEGWAITNLTTDRVLNANSTSIAELADFVGTLVQDLQDKGRLG